VRSPALDEGELPRLRDRNPERTHYYGRARQAQEDGRLRQLVDVPAPRVPRVQQGPLQHSHVAVYSIRTPLLAFLRLPTKRCHADGEHATARVQPATYPKQDLDFGRYWRRHCLHLGRFHCFEEAFPVAMDEELRERDITALLDDARARAR